MSDRAKDLRIGNTGALVLAILNLAGPPAWGTEFPQPTDVRVTTS